MTTIRLQGNVGALLLGRGQAMSCTNADFDVPSQVICGSGRERLAPAASGLIGDVALRTFMQKHPVLAIARVAAERKRRIGGSIVVPKT